jgi:hypothetical protein
VLGDHRRLGGRCRIAPLAWRILHRCECIGWIGLDDQRVGGPGSKSKMNRSNRTAFGLAGSTVRPSLPK